MATKQKNLPLVEKKAPIKSYKKSSLCKTAFVKMHGIAKTTVNDILSSKLSIKKFENDNMFHLLTRLSSLL